MSESDHSQHSKALNPHAIKCYANLGKAINALQAALLGRARPCRAVPSHTSLHVHIGLTHGPFTSSHRSPRRSALWPAVISSHTSPQHPPRWEARVIITRLATTLPHWEARVIITRLATTLSHWEARASLRLAHRSHIVKAVAVGCHRRRQRVIVSASSSRPS